MDISGLNLTGVWQDDRGKTYSVVEGPSADYYLLTSTSTYLTDPACPAAVGTEFLAGAMNSSGIMSGNSTTYPFISTVVTFCTPASNPIVKNCGQDAFWTVQTNVTVTQDAITGQYQNQYWTWDTGENGTITNCRIDHYFTDTFTLTPFAGSASSSSSTTQQDTGTSSSGTSNSRRDTGTSTNSIVQSSSARSTNSSSSTITAAVTTSGSGGGVPEFPYQFAIAAAFTVLLAASYIFIRRGRTKAIDDAGSSNPRLS